MNKLAKLVSGFIAVLALAACGSSAEPEGTDSTSSAALNCAGVGTVYCINGGKWNAQTCSCDKPISDPLLCAPGEHWDLTQCKCVPDQCKEASDCKGPVPNYCLQECPNARGNPCAHHACIGGMCEIVTCK
jgi:hypothetical protein